MSTFNDNDIEDTQRLVIDPRLLLNAVVDDLGVDEVRVLTRIAERLKSGSSTYGPLSIELDDRAFRNKEAREELEDALVYLACAWLVVEGRDQ